MIAAPIAEYYDRVASNLSPASTVRETLHGEVVTDYFHLLKVGDRWLIVSKLRDAESENK